VIQALEAFLREARIGQSRSSVINPLQWVLVIGVATLSFFIQVKAPFWLLASAAIAAGFVLLLVLCAYVYFAFKDPDALRSERYSLVKTAIEKRLVGDNLTGLRDVIETIEGSSPLGNAGGLGPKDE
jgi:apolipoprotein N-acyltransferase